MNSNKKTGRSVNALPVLIFNILSIPNPAEQQDFNQPLPPSEFDCHVTGVADVRAINCDSNRRRAPAFRRHVAVLVNRGGFFVA